MVEKIFVKYSMARIVHWRYPAFDSSSSDSTTRACRRLADVLLTGTKEAETLKASISNLTQTKFYRTHL
jgi:hypothetical protein